MTETPLAAARAATDEFQADDLHVVRPRAAGLDVHKMAITATVRLCEPGQGLPRMATREFSALPKGLRALTAWLCEHGVTAAAMQWHKLKEFRTNLRVLGASKRSSGPGK